MEELSQFAYLDMGPVVGGGQGYLRIMRDLLNANGFGGVGATASALVENDGARLTQVGSWWGASRWIARKQIRRGTPIVLNCWQSALLAPLAVARGLRPVLVIHTTHSGFSPRYLAALRFASRFLRDGIVVSDHLAQTWAPLLPGLHGRFTTIPPPAPRLPFRPAADGPSDSVVFVGRPDRVKQLDALLDVLLHTDRITCLHIFGGSFDDWSSVVDDLPSRVSSVADRGTTVCFHGFVARPFDECPAEAICVLPSLSEGNPLVPVEALANGFAVVLSDISAHRQYVDHDAAIVCDVADRVTFAAALDTLAQSPTRRSAIVLAGQKMLTECFGEAQFIERWTQVLRGPSNR